MTIFCENFRNGIHRFSEKKMKEVMSNWMGTAEGFLAKYSLFSSTEDLFLEEEISEYMGLYFIIEVKKGLMNVRYRLDRHLITYFFSEEIIAHLDIDKLSSDKIISLIVKYQLGLDGFPLEFDDKRFSLHLKEFKPGKLIREIKGDISDSELNNILDLFKYSLEDVLDGVEVIDNVQETYLSEKLKIKSCMTKKDFDLSMYKDLKFKLAVFKDENGNIIARSIIINNEFYSKVYAVSGELSEYFEDALKMKGFINAEGKDILTKTITGDIDFMFVPFMDSTPYIYKKDDKFYFSSVIRRCYNGFKLYATACNMFGGIDRTY